jgi:hypothetical protein
VPYGTEGNNYRCHMELKETTTGAIFFTLFLPTNQTWIKKKKSWGTGEVHKTEDIKQPNYTIIT